ncbi:hypothetical protein B4U80_09934 [Leptotrombidium deliense]|uniref:C2 domain-containing protein n=1 Tax=Leptotrombidium deliense TaxID=299467 RepID=A0A443S819_9ACAR|nr:hypothetical protein B4U80_09934 [Leptotrombidium deliense]
MIQLNENDDSTQYPVALSDRIDNDSKAGFEMYRIPPAIRPEMSKYKLEVLFWGLRELKKIQFLDIEKPRVDVELGGCIVSSDELINFKENPNFSNPLKSIDVDLPNNLLQPALTIRIVHKQSGQLLLDGSHIIPYIQNLIYKEAPQGEETVEIGIDPKKYITETSQQNGDIYKTVNREGEEIPIDWWMRYKASLEQYLEEEEKVSSTENESDSQGEYKEPHIPQNMLIKLFDTELEKSNDFGKITDWGLRSFPLFKAKKKSSLESGDSETIGVFKGSIQLYKDPIPNESINENQEAVEPVSVLVRVYIVDAQNLVGKTGSNRINPYITFVLGGKKASDKDNYFENQQNPKIGKCFEFEAVFPQDSLLTVQVHGYDRYGVDYLIGETKIDLENRYYSRHRLLCGLPQLYQPEGLDQWRDSCTPSEILEKLCNDLKLFGPEYWDDSIKVGKYSFVFTSDAENPSANPLEKEQMCLAVLNNWKQAFGYALLPEHVETRPLYNSRKPGLQQGSLHMWVDMFPRDLKEIPPPVDIAPQRLNCYELRVIIHRITDVQLKDVTFFTGERTGALYFKGWLMGANDTQVTDIQRTYTGEANVNWRFIFPFDYNPKQQQIVECQNAGQGHRQSMKSKSPELHIQLWDSRTLTNDKNLCCLCLPLNKLSNIAKTPRQCSLPTQSDSNNNSVISLFKEKSVEGWWPLVSEKHGETSMRGKLLMSIELLTKEEAAENPAGFGRNAPLPLPKPK